MELLQHALASTVSVEGMGQNGYKRSLGRERDGVRVTKENTQSPEAGSLTAHHAFRKARRRLQGENTDKGAQIVPWTQPCRAFHRIANLRYGDRPVVTASE